MRMVAVDYDHYWHLDENLIPAKDAYFLHMALAASLRADCTRSRVGAILVVEDSIRASGYNHAPRGDNRLCSKGACPRASSDDPPGTGSYDECIYLHAEQFMLAHATYEEALGSTVYITRAPCPMCKKSLQAAGVLRVVYIADRI